MSQKTLGIGEVAAQAGLRTSSIRYYESVGVLPAPERVAGRRRYTPDVLDRLRFVDVAQRAGFSLAEIRELLEGAERGGASASLQALAQRRLPDVEGLIARAEAMRAWLEAAAECECPSLESCALFA
jgi:MerR family redox-sensitive transcriptional activator SoxR